MCNRKKRLFYGLVEKDKNILVKIIRTPDGRERVLHIVRRLPNYGNALVVITHNKDMGTAYYPDIDFITPNMPKLKYAIDFKVRGADIIPTGVNPDVMEHAGDTGYVFIKRDGFNVLFYELNGEVVPKTRLLPVAGKHTRTFIEKELPKEFHESVRRMVKDGFVPIFEVWGPKLDEYEILYGSTDPRLAIEVEGKKGEVFAELIAVRNNDYCDYPYYPAKGLHKLAEEYGFETPPLVKKLKINDEKKLFLEILEIMDKFAKFNEEHGGYVYEGGVLHIGAGVNYGMFKVKETNIMKKDVILAGLTENADIIKKIDYEVSKILLDFSPDQILFDDWPLVKQQLREYLAEDITDKDVLDKAYSVALWHLVEKASKFIIERYLDDYCKKIREKYREYRKRGIRIDKKRKAMVNKIMAECRKKGKL